MNRIESEIEREAEREKERERGKEQEKKKKKKKTKREGCSELAGQKQAMNIAAWATKGAQGAKRGQVRGSAETAKTAK